MVDASILKMKRGCKNFSKEKKREKLQKYLKVISFMEFLC
jgi:hypothetical protein